MLLKLVCWGKFRELILASAVGAKKRLEIVEKAKKLGVAVTNGNARLATEE
jgi:ribosomal protein L32E